MIISETIKRLRRERNLTQEALAARLNISPQAVSKWERGETLPDITMIIPLAEVLKTTTDELLGVNAVRDAERGEEYFQKRRELLDVGGRLEALQLLKTAYGEFPNNYKIMAYYAEALLCFRYAPDEVIADVPDFGLIEKLCLCVTDDCPVQELRFFAAETLMLAYQYTDRKQKAVELTEVFPENYYDTKFERLLPLLDGEEQLALELKTLQNAVDFLLNKLRYAKLSIPPETVSLTEKLAELLMDANSA